MVDPRVRCPVCEIPWEELKGVACMSGSKCPREDLNSGRNVPRDGKTGALKRTIIHPEGRQKGGSSTTQSLPLAQCQRETTSSKGQHMTRIWLSTDGDIEEQARTLARRRGHTEPDMIDKLRAELQIRFRDYNIMSDYYLELKAEKGMHIASDMQVRAAVRYANISRQVIKAGLNPDPTR